jgi:hypothetical protein
MNKSELIEEVARIAGLTHEESETVITAVFERIVRYPGRTSPAPQPPEPTTTEA